MSKFNACCKKALNSIMNKDKFLQKCIVGKIVCNLSGHRKQKDACYKCSVLSKLLELHSVPSSEGWSQWEQQPALDDTISTVRWQNKNIV